MSIPEIQQPQPLQTADKSVEQTQQITESETKIEPSVDTESSVKTVPTQNEEIKTLSNNNDIKSEPDDPSLSAAIVRQVEFYFSNSNLPKDKYLLSFYESDPENFVPISEIASFARMKKLTEDINIVISALEKSQKLRLNSKKTHVTRIEPLPNQLNSTKSTIYIKGIPLQSTLDDITAKFNRWDVKVQCVRMRRHYDTKEFKGSAFVEFESEDDAKNFVNQKWKWNENDENDVIVMMKQKYFNEKKGMDNNKDNEQKEQSNKKRKAGNQLEQKTYTKGLLLRFNTLPTQPNREMLRAFVENVAVDVKAKFVDLPENQIYAVVRLKEDSSLNAVQIIEKLKEDKKELTEGFVPELSVLEGEEEENYYQAIFDRFDQREQQRGRNGRRGKRQRC